MRVSAMPKFLWLTRISGPDRETTGQLFYLLPFVVAIIVQLPSFVHLFVTPVDIPDSSWLRFPCLHRHSVLLWPAHVLLIAQSCLILCNPIDYSLPGSTLHGILQARILEWIAIPFSRASSLSGVEPGSPALQADSLMSELSGSTKNFWPTSSYLGKIKEASH